MPPDALTTPDARRAHWDGVYQRVDAAQVSWYQPAPEMSLRLIATIDAAEDAAIIDIGGGASGLAAALVGAGRANVSVLDVSASALAVARHQLGDRAGAVHWIEADVLTWTPDRQYAVWHDRAVFHFMVDAADRQRYVGVATAAVGPGGHLVVATFAPDGPERCSGLPAARYGPADLAAAFAPGFTLVGSDREVHTTPSGAAQPFTWVVLRRSA